MNNQTSKTEPHQRYHLRWCWLGLCLALILWFGSDIYYQKIEQIDEIDSFSTSVSQDETSKLSTQRKRNHQWHHYAAIIIALGSITYGGRITYLSFRKYAERSHKS
jgi:hypothetical protein